MYHYLFTNDLRISQLASSLTTAGRCFIEGTVPPSSIDKSANNNMMTLGFYFNLTKDSRCSEAAANGDTRTVVLNFIKKFQFPNRRTTESYNAAISDGIILAPMRIIVKLLYLMNMTLSSEQAYLTREEIKNFIFYNYKVAKTKNPQTYQILNDLLEYRTTGSYPSSIDLDENEHSWKHEDRQLREMIKVLTWSGCVQEQDEEIRIVNNSLSRDNKADIFDIINYNEYLEGPFTEEEYRKYMDLSENELFTNSNVNKLNSNELFTGENTIYYGVPGSGKSYLINNKCEDEEYMERIVFHPDYSYSDFIGQILPRVNADGKLEYVFTPGPFTKILAKAVNDPQHMYYLIIEELNRGNAPAIFGEIFQLLDRNNNEELAGISEYGITNYDIASVVYSDQTHPIRIPSNMSILATMNTSDQNVFTLDTAFQRRWNMRHVTNKFIGEHAESLIEGSSISWGAFARTVNDVIAKSNSDISSMADKRLGLYFIKPNELTKTAFSEKVLKYLWDDALKMDKYALFSDYYLSLGDILDAYQNSSDNPLKAILKEDVYRRMTQEESYSHSISAEEL